MLAYASLQLFDKKYIDVVKNYVFIVTGFIGAFILSAVQVLPSIELHGQSIRSEAFSLEQTTHFSYNPKSLLTLIDPNILGKIQDGSYQFMRNINDHGNIYWETQTYMGIVALLLLIGSLFFIRRKQIWSLWIMILGSALLMFASYSPLYLIYSIPPFNFFTTPARFLIMFITFATIAMAFTLVYAMERIKDKRIKRAVPYVLSIMVVANIFVSWYGYGVRLPVDEYMTPPETASFILEDDSIPPEDKRVVSFESGAWHAEFLENGWSRGNDYTEFFNDVSPNMNSLWEVQQHKAYVGRIWTQRKFMYDQNLAGIVNPESDEIRRGPCGETDVPREYKLCCVTVAT